MSIANDHKHQDLIIAYFQSVSLQMSKINKYNFFEFIKSLKIA
jgi:hypothetical protein